MPDRNEAHRRSGGRHGKVRDSWPRGRVEPGSSQGQRRSVDVVWGSFGMSVTVHAAGNAGRVVLLAGELVLYGVYHRGEICCQRQRQQEQGQEGDGRPEASTIHLAIMHYDERQAAAARRTERLDVPECSRHFPARAHSITRPAVERSTRLASGRATVVN